MITFEEAIAIIESQPLTGKTEQVDFLFSAGRILAEDVVSDVNMPPFHKSAMDGYACKMEDLPGPFRVIEEIPAGKMPLKTIESGTCSRIMTGAPLPEGANCVMMEEHTSRAESGEIIFTRATSKSNICRLGEDVKEGDVLIEAGTLIEPAHIAIMASAGATKIMVSTPPTLGVYSTGDELVEPWVRPEGSMIRNSNGYQITAQLLKSGFQARYRGIIHDNPADTERSVREGLSSFDVVVLSGGVSMGDYDFVPLVMEKLGIEILFHHLAVQPGKPSLFGRTKDHTYIFGLPGNPVSSFIQTELLVKLLCYRLQGYKPVVPQIKLPLGLDYRRKKAERKSFIPVMIRESKIFPVEYHGSAHIQALNGAQAIISIEPGTEVIMKGELVDVRFI